MFGTYLHGLFDTGELTEKLAAWLLACKGLSAADVRAESHAAYKERQYDLLADVVRGGLDMSFVYRVLRRDRMYAVFGNGRLRGKVNTEEMRA